MGDPHWNTASRFPPSGPRCPLCRDSGLVWNESRKFPAADEALLIIFQEVVLAMTAIAHWRELKVSLLRPRSQKSSVRKSTGLDDTVTKMNRCASCDVKEQNRVESSDMFEYTEGNTSVFLGYLYTTLKNIHNGDSRVSLRVSTQCHPTPSFHAVRRDKDNKQGPDTRTCITMRRALQRNTTLRRGPVCACG